MAGSISSTSAQPINAQVSTADNAAGDQINRMFDEVGTAAPAAATAAETPTAYTSGQMFDMVNTAMTVPKSPLEAMISQIMMLLKQLMQLVTGTVERPIPAVPPTVKVGDTVGSLTSTKGAGLPLKVEDVVSAHTSEADARAAAIRYSNAHGGEPVAIVKTLRYPGGVPGKGGPVQTSPTGGVPAPPAPSYVYNVVTLDPAVSTRFASRVTGATPKSGIVALVEGSEVAYTGARPMPMPVPPGPLPKPMPVPTPTPPPPGGTLPPGGVLPPGGNRPIYMDGSGSPDDPTL